MYNGYVCRMDTVAFEFNGILPVGPNPEIIAVQGDFLYVPNSDGMNWQEGYGTTATRIDLSTFTVERNFEVPLNPYKFIAGDGVDMYLICRGDYGETPAKLYKFNPFTLESTPLVNASYASYYDGKLYAIDAPWDKPATYSIVDASTGDVTPMPEKIKVDSPTNIAICPFNGNLFITSCKLSNGYADYSQPGYCSTFSLDGKLLGSYETGVNPSNIFF